MIETCQQYLERRLSEGWKEVCRFGNTVFISPPNGAFIRPVNLLNDTETLRPDAAGDETNLTPYGNSENWDCVDEETADGDATYVRGVGLDYSRDLYNLPASSGSGTINFIKVYFRIKDNTGVAYAKPVVKSNSTITEGTEVEHNTGDYETYSQQWDTNPADGQPWGSDWSVIDALQIGEALKNSLSKGQTFCTQVYVEVDYTAVTEKTSSDSGAGVDAYVSLETGEAKSSSDTGSGVEGTPLPSATLAGSENGSGIEALVARLLAAVDTGSGVEVGGLLKDLFATELGLGSDSLIAKIEMPTKGGGMKLWT